MALRHYHCCCYLYIDARMLSLSWHSGKGSSDCNAVKLCCICLWLCIAHKHANWWYVIERLNSASVVERHWLLSPPWLSFSDLIAASVLSPHSIRYTEPSGSPLPHPSDIRPLIIIDVIKWLAQVWAISFDYFY